MIKLLWSSFWWKRLEKKTDKHCSKSFSWFYDFFRPPKLSQYIVIHLNLHIEVGTEMISVDYISLCYNASGSSKSRKEWRRQIEDEVEPGIKSSLNSSAIHVAAAAQINFVTFEGVSSWKGKEKAENYFWRAILLSNKTNIRWEM